MHASSKSIQSNTQPERASGQKLWEYLDNEHFRLPPHLLSVRRHGRRPQNTEPSGRDEGNANCCYGGPSDCRQMFLFRAEHNDFPGCQPFRTFRTDPKRPCRSRAGARMGGRDVWATEGLWPQLTTRHGPRAWARPKPAKSRPRVQHGVQAPAASAGRRGSVRIVAWDYEATSKWPCDIFIWPSTVASECSVCGLDG